MSQQDLGNHEDESPLDQSLENAGSSNLPAIGAHCGIRPDPESMEQTDGIDFSEAAKLLDIDEDDTYSDKES